MKEDIARLKAVLKDLKEKLLEIRKQIMKIDNSWEISTEKYINLYNSIRQM